MRICHNCGAELEDFEEFCPECGAPVDDEPAEYYEEEAPDEYYEEDEHLKACPHCGEYVNLDADVCPACQYVFRKRFNKKLLVLIGCGIAAVALIAVIIVLLTGKKDPVIAIVDPTSAPIVTVTEAPAPVVTSAPVENTAPVPAANTSTEDDALAAHRDEALTIFELLDPASGSGPSVTLTSLDGNTKTVDVSTAENYISKLLSLSFGDGAGFNYNFYRADDSTWRLVMSGALKDEQMNKMLAMEDSNIYATFRNMYMNPARQIISKATGMQPTITISVYERGKSDDDYSLRIVETEAGNGTVSRAA